MSCSDRRTLLLSLALLPLAGCGFRPAYGTAGAAGDLRGRVAVAEPTNRYEFELVGRLQQRLGRPEAPLYDLSYRLTTDEQGLTVTGQQEITRYNVIGALQFQLGDRQSGALVASGQITNFTGYSATGTTVSTLTAQQDAYDRLMVILADQLVTRLLAVATERQG